jgi:hypothetical protein
MPILVGQPADHTQSDPAGSESLRGGCAARLRRDSSHAEFYVGDLVTNRPPYDSACTHNDTQSAIDATTCSCYTEIFVTREHSYMHHSLNISTKKIMLIGRSDIIKCGPVTIGICDPVLGGGPMCNSTCQEFLTSGRPIERRCAAARFCNDRKLSASSAESLIQGVGP